MPKLTFAGIDVDLFAESETVEELAAIVARLDAEDAFRFIAEWGSQVLRRHGVERERQYIADLADASRASCEDYASGFISDIAKAMGLISGVGETA